MSRGVANSSRSQDNCAAAGGPWWRRPVAVRVWLLLAFTLFFVRIILILFVMPDSGLVPDEGLYVAISDGLSRRLDQEQLSLSLGYEPDFVASTWVLTLPASTLSHIGVLDYSSVRIISSFLSLLSALLFITMVAMVREHSLGSTHDTETRNEPGFSFVSGPGVATLIFLFLPSHALWGTLALRDSSSEFAALATVAGVVFLLLQQSRLWKAAGFLLVIVGLAGLEGSRSYLVALIVLAVLSIVFWWPRAGRPTLALSLIAALFIGLFLGSRVAATALQVVTDPAPPITTEAPLSPIQTPLPPTETALPPTEAASPPTEAAPDWSLLQEQVLSRIDSRVAVFSENRRGMMENAQSAYAFNYCVGTTELVTTARCELTYLPLGIARFLGSPMYVPWNENTSSWRTLAGVENFAWLTLLVGALLTLVLRRSVNTRLTSMLVVYTLLFVVAYALVSGNEGTAFRHKSQMLWAISLIIAFGYGWRTWVPRLGTKVEAPLARDLDITTKGGN